ncbi:helix-turn-helix transcriptional regulator [[Clostridium] spiroforme]|nr:helix-turn-helix transcriptional regulator [Thomasclavelia spiroformis]
MDNIKIGKLIAKRRKQKGLTQSQLAEYLGVSNKTVSKWENDIPTF